MPRSPNVDNAPIKSIILCADDYGQNEAISAGILELARAGRINAVSCMVNAPFWRETHRALDEIKSSTYIGLHLNLTEGEPFSALWRTHHGTSFLTLPVLITKAYLRRLKVQTVAAEIEAQIDAFLKSMHAYPDFIDGHQHVHQLPIVRDALLLVYRRLELQSFIRSTSNGWRDLWSVHGFPKRSLITVLGGVALRRALVKQGIAHNTNFSGIYAFRQSPHYRRYFNWFLSQIQDGGLIMCHPGKASNDRSDPLSSSRHHELSYCLSDAFLGDLNTHSIQLLCKGTE